MTLQVYLTILLHISALLTIFCHINYSLNSEINPRVASGCNTHRLLALLLLWTGNPPQGPMVSGGGWHVRQAACPRQRAMEYRAACLRCWMDARRAPSVTPSRIRTNDSRRARLRVLAGCVPLQRSDIHTSNPLTAPLLARTTTITIRMRNFLLL